MSDNKTAKLIFEKWHAEFSEMKKSKEHYYDNFYSLFSEMRAVDIPFDTAYDFLKSAISRHIPSSSTVKFIYKKNQGKNRGSTEQEFLEEWKDLIKSKAFAAFHDIYPLQADGTPKPDQELPKAISREEYGQQRKHANSFPILDLSKIKDPYTRDDDELES